MAKRYWLIKSEPETYGIDQLKRDTKTLWEGVRNYQARNFMTNDMKVGDQVIFYHSSAEPPGAAGIAQISAAAVPDPTQFNAKSDDYDKKATTEKPIWFCVEVKYVKTFKRFVPIAEIRGEKALSSMALLQRGQRLSIQPVTEKEFELICDLGQK